MKIKCRPEDFRVEELPSVEPGDSGPFVYYRLSKTGLGTPEAIEAIRRRWNLAPGQVQYGGLKDRHAETVQYLTIRNGPERDLKQSSFVLEPLGRLKAPYGPNHFRGNLFRLVIRDLTEDDLAKTERAAAEVTREGVPNYFDDQRFGSISKDGQFVAAFWLKDDHERALWLALAGPTSHDRPHAKREKQLLRETWGRWVELKTALGKSHARSIVTYLVDHPQDFRGAFARLRVDMRRLYFSAYQSHLWNRILASWIEKNTTIEQRVLIPFRTGLMPIFRSLNADQISMLHSMVLPLPSSRSKLGDGPSSDLAREVVSEAGHEWEGFRVRHLKDVFFSKGNRPAAVTPQTLSHLSGPDELHKGRLAIQLSFQMMRGAYATLVVKRLTEAAC